VKLTTSIASFFNLDIICAPCAMDERQAPGYQAAHDAEVSAIKNGNFNFPGAGLSPEDIAFLAWRRAERKATNPPAIVAR